MSKDLLRNGSFERGNLDFWEVYIGTAVVQTAEVARGNYAVLCTVPAIFAVGLRGKDFLPVRGGELYKMVGSFKNVDATGLTCGVICYDSARNTIPGGSLIVMEKGGAYDWTVLKGYFEIPEEASYMKAHFIFAGTEGQYGYADALSLERMDISKIATRQVEMVSVVDLTAKDTYYSAEFFTGLWLQAEYALYCSSLTGTVPTLNVTIQGYDPSTEQWKDILVFQELTTAGSEFKTVLSGLGWEQRVKYVLGGDAVTDCDFIVGAVYKR